MKRTERQHLKENAVAQSMARAQETFQRHRRSILAAVAVLALIAVAVVGYAVWRSRGNAAASGELAEAMNILSAPVTPPAAPAADGSTPAPTPVPGAYPTETAKLEAALPRLMAAAEIAPAAEPGLSARYQAAATLALLGRMEEAEQRYKEVQARDPQGLYGEMARLGLAELSARTGKVDQAIETWTALASATTGSVPADGALMQLGRAYLLADKPDEAAQTFQRIVDEFPDSTYAQAARQELDILRPAGRTN